MAGAVSRETSAKIVNLSLVFVLLVVQCHVGWVAEGAFGQAMITVFTHCLAHAVVPFFFAVSGYFLAVHSSEEGWWREALRKRVRTLFVPYVFWLAVQTLVILALTGRWIAGWGGLVGLNLCHLPIVGPLWYVRSLMLFVLISPLVKRALARWGVGWIVAMYLVDLATSVLTGCGVLEFESGLGGFLGYGLAVEGLVYFSLGFYLREHPVTIRSPRLPALASVLCVALIAVRVLLTHFRLPAYVHHSVFVSPCFLLGAWYFAPTFRLPSALAACTFPLYVMHAIVYAALWACGVPRAAGWQWLTLGAGIALPVAVSLIVRRACPRVAAWIFGGR